MYGPSPWLPFYACSSALLVVLSIYMESVYMKFQEWIVLYVGMLKGYLQKNFLLILFSALWKMIFGLSNNIAQWFFFFFFGSQSISNRTNIVLSLFLACSHGMLLLFSPQVMSNSLWSHGLQYTRLPCPSPSLKVCPSSCPLNWWCHPTVSSSVTLFSFHLQSFPASGSFPMS